MMETVTVSPKFQVVLPRKIRRALAIDAGQKIQVFLYNNRIELIPIQPMKHARGFLAGIDTSIEEEPERL